MNTTTDTKERVDFGVYGGRYRKVQTELFKDLKRIFGLDDAESHMVCVQFSTDVGRAVADSEVTKVAIGKLDKNGMMSLRDITKAVKAVQTNAIAIANSVNILNSCRDDVDFTNVKLSKKHLDWIADRMP